MGSLVALGLAGGLSVWALAAPWRAGLGILVGVTVLVPATIGVPNPLVGDALTIHRAVVLSLLLGLLVHRDPDPRERGRFVPPPVAGALAVYVAVALVVGVLLADAPTDLSLAVLDWFKALDQLVVFVVAVALVRARGPERAAVVVGIAALAMVALVGFEVVVGRSVAGLLFDPSIGGAAARDELELRGAGVRPRGGAEFALQAAWLLLTMLPLAVIASQHRLRRWIASVGGIGPGALLVAAVIGVTAAAMLATQTRSALLALPVIVLLLALLARHPAVWLAVPLLATTASVALIQPTIATRLTEAADPGAIAVRFERLPTVLAATSDSAVLGLGFAGLDARGVPTTDVSYLLTYAETGAVGLVLFLFAAVLGVIWCLRGLRGVPGRRQQLAAAGAVAGVAMLVGGIAFDAFSLGSSARLFWIVVAIGGVAGERLVGRHRLPRLRPRLVSGVAVAGLLLGVLGLALGPRPVTARYLFTTVPTETEAVVDVGGGYVGTVLASSVCGALEAGTPEPGVAYECHLLPTVPGAGEVRILADSPADVLLGADSLQAYAREQLGVDGFELAAHEAPDEEPPSLLRSSPAWLALLGVGLAVTVPRRSEDDLEAPRRPAVVSA